MNKPVLRLKSIKSEQTSISPDFLHKLKDFFKLDIFLETGTCFGYTTLAVSEFFDEVHTVELSKNLYDNNLKKFSDKKNITAWHGDSAKILPELLPKMNGSILFWLDGHNGSGETSRALQNTPVLDELKTISNNRNENMIILIDDMRIFLPDTWKTPDWINGYPTVNKIYDDIMKINRNAKFCIYGDIAIAVFPPYEIEFSPVIKGCTVSRMYNGYNFPHEQVISADRIISKAEKDERITLEMLPDDYPSLCEYGYCGHFLLWNGLIKYNHGDFERAAQIFEAAIGKGCDNWRPKYYQSIALNKSGNFIESGKILEELFDSEPIFKTFWQKSGTEKNL